MVDANLEFDPVVYSISMRAWSTPVAAALPIPPGPSYGESLQFLFTKFVADPSSWSLRDDEKTHFSSEELNEIAANLRLADQCLGPVKPVACHTGGRTLNAYLSRIAPQRAGYCLLFIALVRMKLGKVISDTDMSIETLALEDVQPAQPVHEILAKAYNDTRAALHREREDRQLKRQTAVMAVRRRAYSP
jgi:hypothetical protein